MSDMRYFMELDRDVTSMCQGADATEFDNNEYYAALEILQKSRYALYPDEPNSYAELGNEPAGGPITDLGKKILALRNQVVRLSGFTGTYICCGEAEWKLAHSLQPHNVQDANLRSPLLLTLHHRVVAVRKQWGEGTWYGLADVPERGIYAGAFHALHGLSLARKLPRADVAYQNELPMAAEPRLIRFSLFATPLNTRRHLQTYGDEAEIVRDTSHADIVHSCEELLRQSIPVSDIS